ncbi:MAG: Gfo/Idh/MocA family oxidoreductase [Verrucomicrobia bacterium]|nr:MAG: Gfo/Idh/MocA family oxidoreductase [Verrucomicrobiota bacterium]
MKIVRIGIIGMGNIGKHHAGYLLDGKVDRCQLTAVCSTSPDKLADYAAKGVTVFRDAKELLSSKKVEAVIIATPHYQHTTLGIAAFDAGLHLMVEKPISAHKADAEKLIKAHKKNTKLVFGGMFQLRVEPRYEKIRALIRGGDLGEIVRVNWVNTDWFRSEAYYVSSAWRATWKGEGGGVLINQCLHNLDVLQWLLGMPVSVRGYCQLGRFHQIEVEDNVTAYLEWSNGATGVFVSSTGEAPGANRFEIVGTRGTLVLENGKLMFTRNAVDMVEFSRTAKIGFSKPEAKTEEVSFANAAAPHAALTQNFVNAILDGELLIAPGHDGIHSVELANAMVFSSLEKKSVELPMSGVAWEKKLNQLITESKLEKKVMFVEASDFASSFRK